MPGGSWPQLLAHRCGGAHAPENTLAGLFMAARLGCRAVEFDVMLSRDAVPVLIHDETLMRTAGIPGRVCELDAARLLATDVGRSFHPAFAGETIPSLEAALAACRDLGLAANLEIKPAAGFELRTGQVVGDLLRTLTPSALPPMLLSSFSLPALRAAAERAPDFTRALLVEAYSPKHAAQAVDQGCAYLNVGVAGLDEAHVRAAHAAGLRLLVYTVNDRRIAAQFMEWGVDGLFSDRPDLLLPGNSGALIR